MEEEFCVNFACLEEKTTKKKKPGTSDGTYSSYLGQLQSSDYNSNLSRWVSK